ncbi:MAG: DUF1634 domain-containing protein [Paenibacillaceae bacterium]|uniref:DUF1634 domain-containing protein n=1 Tax=Paenibacillus mellifer TaxID=2937794 RepID=A0A9X1Y3Q5_9BACL|nr:DUF1634 domain-containing protein [Paenibacillus mellifer]MBW4840194.1 DUF1634 domain-containing protein [Paenibacillaceae bacterium]MCK8490184.1 DUF1634 domain-containing protein [Paenibacillus mellifer]
MGGPNDAAQSRTFEIETAISKMLRIGVMLAAIVIVTGLVQYLVTGDSGYPGDTYPTSFGAMMSGLVAFKAAAVIQTGLLLLILTPVFRVFISLFLFWAERDYRYVIITAVVFVILILSFALGKAG